MTPQDIDAFQIPWPDETPDPMGLIGLRVSLYFSGGHEIATRQALMRIIDQYVDFSGGRIQLYQEAGDRRFRSASAASPVDLSSSRAAAQARMTPLGLFLSGSEDVGKASHWSLVSIATYDGYLLMHFPLAAFEGAQPHTFRKLFQQWCTELNVQHAYAGLGVVLPTGGRAMHAAIKHCTPVVSRFIGLDLDYPNATGRSCKNGIRCINWLSAINSKWLEKVHGAETVLRIAGTSVSSMPYGSGTIFIAGEAPQIGDVEKNLLPQEYMALGRAVAPLRVDYKDWLFEPPPGFTAPDGFTASFIPGRVEHEDLARYYYTQQWMARFDG